MTRNEQALITMVSSTIVEFHNEYAAQPVKKFQDKQTAVRRTAAVLDEAGMVFDEVCQLRPKKLNFNDDAQHEIDSAHMVDEDDDAPLGQPSVPLGCDENGEMAFSCLSPDVDLEQLSEFGLGDNAMNAECPHCGIDHYDNGWQMHGEEHKCDDMMFSCLACGGEWGPKIKRRASDNRQPPLKGKRLSVVGGKDAANPFREGSKSHATFAMVQANPGKTYEELRDMGARMRTITHSTKQGWIRAH